MCVCVCVCVCVRHVSQCMFVCVAMCVCKHHVRMCSYANGVFIMISNRGHTECIAYASDSTAEPSPGPCS